MAKPVANPRALGRGRIRVSAYRAGPLPRHIAPSAAIAESPHARILEATAALPRLSSAVTGRT